MKSPRVATRRVLALFGAAAIATVAAVAIATPASAHHPTVTGTAQCDATTGTWQVTWIVTNSESDIQGQLTEVTLSPSGSTVTNIAVGSMLPVSTAPPLTGVQVLPGTATGATLHVTAYWHRPQFDVTKGDGSSVTFTGTCAIPKTAKPAANFSSHCNGTVTATLINGKEATAPAAFTVTGDAGFSQGASVDPNDSATVDIPAASATTIKVMAGGKLVASGTHQDPADCAAPATTMAETCNSLSLTVSNPDTGRPVDAVLTPSTGDATTFSLAPGEEKSATFAASAGMTLTSHVTGLDDKTVAWTEPESCAPQLPKTGTSLTPAISGGAALVVIGAAILFVVRRRRGAHARF